MTRYEEELAAVADERDDLERRARALTKARLAARHGHREPRGDDDAELVDLMLASEALKEKEAAFDARYCRPDATPPNLE